MESSVNPSLTAQGVFTELDVRVEQILVLVVRC